MISRHISFHTNAPKYTKVTHIFKRKNEVKLNLYKSETHTVNNNLSPYTIKIPSNNIHNKTLCR